MADGEDENLDFSNVLLAEGPDLFSKRGSATDQADLALSLAGQNGQDNPNDLLAPEPLRTDKASGSSFKTMGTRTHDVKLIVGFGATLMKAITRKGYKNPTPIQRKTIPPIMDGRDVVGMARTGSGKTACFVLPMIERLKIHSAKVGGRAILFAPSRELALQTLKVVKEMSRGTDLRTTMLVGGDSLEDQFRSIMTNPDMYSKPVLV